MLGGSVNVRCEATWRHRPDVRDDDWIPDVSDNFTQATLSKSRGYVGLPAGLLLASCALPFSGCFADCHCPFPCRLAVLAVLASFVRLRQSVVSRCCVSVRVLWFISEVMYCFVGRLDGSCCKVLYLDVKEPCFSISLLGAMPSIYIYLGPSIGTIGTYYKGYITPRVRGSNP